MRTKILWDFCMTCASNFPLYHGVLFKKDFLEGGSKRAEEVHAMMERFHQLDRRMVKFLREWGDRSSGEKANPGYVNYIDFKPLEELAHRNAGPESKGFEEMQRNLERLEEIAQAFFFLALHDVLPEEIKSFDKLWVNPLGVSLDPARWEADGLRKPTAASRDIVPILAHLTQHLLAKPAR
jgi:hypothetical protein